MELMTSWGRKGVHMGKEDSAAQMIRKRFGIPTEEVAPRLARLSSEQLNELGMALFDFASFADLEEWLARQ